MPRYLSPSQVADWEECPQKWALLKVERKKPAPTWPFIDGRGVHDALWRAGQDYIEGAPDFASPAQRVEALFEVYRSTIERELRKDDPDGLILLSQRARGETNARAVLTAFVDRILPKYRPISTEETLGEEVGLAIPDTTDWYFTGRIDARVRLREGYAVVDWKTGQAWPPDAELEKPQGRAYPWAELERWKIQADDPDAMPPAFVVLFITLPVVDGVCTPDSRGVTPSLASLVSYGEQLKFVANAIDESRTTGIYPARTGSRCARCSVLAHCAFGSDYVRKKRLPVLTPGVKLG